MASARDRISMRPAPTRRACAAPLLRTQAHSARCPHADMPVALDLLALGEAMIEFNQAHADDPRTYLQGFGGDTSNTAIAAARLGVRAGYASRVGNDAFGRWL